MDLIGKDIKFFFQWFDDLLLKELSLKGIKVRIEFEDGWSDLGCPSFFPLSSIRVLGLLKNVPPVVGVD